MLDRVIKYGFVMAVTGFFAAMWGLLLLQHFPASGHSTLRPAYAQLLKPDQNERNEQWGVYFAGRRIGRSAVEITRDMGGQMDVRSTTLITIEPVMRLLTGLSGDLDVSFEASVSPLTGLHDFQLSSDRIGVRMLGTAGEGALHITGHVGKEPIRTVLPYSPDVMLGETFSPLASLPKLSKSDLGRTWSVDMINPLTGGMQTVTVRVAAMREVELAGGKTRVFRLDFATGSSRCASWVQQDGELLIQGTPFGLTLRREGLPPSVANQLEAEQPGQSPSGP